MEGVVERWGGGELGGGDSGFPHLLIFGLIVVE